MFLTSPLIDQALSLKTPAESTCVIWRYFANCLARWARRQCLGDQVPIDAEVYHWLRGSSYNFHCSRFGGTECAPRVTKPRANPLRFSR